MASKPQATTASDEAVMASIESQLRALHGMQTRMTSACYEKCIPGAKPRDGELSLGEMTCIDRCVTKYFETQAAVRAELEKARNRTPIDFP